MAILDSLRAGVYFGDKFLLPLTPYQESLP